MAGYLKPFESVNFTPPHGRLGHSVPTPRPLGGPPQEMDENRQDSQMALAAADVHSTTSLLPPTVKASPAQFYCRRDHAFGGGFSRLDRIRTHQDLPYIMESFAEVQENSSEGEEEEEGDETDSGRPQSLKSIASSNHRRVNVTLDRFTGDSLLHFSYSPAAGSMGLGPPDSQLGGSFVMAFSQGLSLNTSLNAPFLHQNLSPSGESSHLFPTAARNPNKAIVTIDAQSSLILTANEMTCELFGYQKDELVGMKVQCLFTELYQANQRALVEHNIDASGETVLVSGKVMDAVTSYGIEFPVSVWMKRVSPAVQPRVIVVIEPVERTSAHFTVDEKGTLVSSDPWFACIFGFAASSEMVGRSVLEFIPSLLMPTNTAELSALPPKQALTGRTKDGGVFPLTVKFTDVSQNLSVGDLYSHSEGTTTSQEELSPSVVIKRCDSSSSAHSQPAHSRPNGGGTSDSVIISKGETPVDLNTTGGRSDSDSSVHVKCVSESESSRSPTSVEGEVPIDRQGSHYCINAKVIVYAVLSGMISFLPDGTIHGCNHHFALMLFGYSQQELLKKDITYLIPEFYNHISYVDDRGMPLPPLDEEDGDEDDMFPLVAERSLSPDKAFETFRSTTGQAEARVTLSPSHRMGTNVLRSPLRQAGLGGYPAGLRTNASCSNDSGMGSNVVMRPRSAPEFLPEEPESGVACSHAADAASNKRPDQQQIFVATSETAASKSELLVTLFPEESLEDGGGGDGNSSGISEGLTPSSSQVMNEGITPSSSQVISEELTPSSSQVMSEDLTPSSSQVISEGLTLSSPQVMSEVDDSRTPSDDREHNGVMQHEGVAQGSASEELATMSTGIDIDTRQVVSVMTTSAGIETATGNGGPEDLAAVVRPVSSMSEPGGGREMAECTTLVNSPSVDQLIELLSGQRKKQGGSVAPSDKDPFSSIPATRSTESLQYSRSGSAAVTGGMGSGGVRGMDECSVTSISSLPEGTFLGEARHKDGSLLAIVFQLKCFALADGMPLFCIWISRDMDCERARNADLSMSMNRQPVDPYRTDQIISPDVGLPPDPTSPHPRQQQEEQVAEEGEYSNHYDTLRPMGKGAFGFVRMAQRRDDGTAVVVKFLRKASVLKDCWVQDEEMGEVPLEISLLARLAHPNIVQLLEAYENEHYFQMVMEKHGDGLDLFEFIEKNPRLNEPLMSYMFRQVVAGLAYLHERNILHRDVKDENIILDHRFHLKLIDFGSAAYMEPGKLFNTFCGTLEYCSPEVLLGNSYSGPELEMWALGVTLYTLVFGENPFFEVEETISGHLQPPYLTSPALMKIIFWLLHPDPRSRASLRDLQKDKWVNQPVDISQYSFELVMGYATNSSTPKRVTVKALSMDNEHLDTSVRKLQQALDEQLPSK